MSIHAPSVFLREHWRKLLPGWSDPVQSVLLYLQPSPVQLSDRTSETEVVKDSLRADFLQLAEQWSGLILRAGFLAEPFDPKHGTPLYSAPGEWPLDDVAVAHALLHYPITEEGGCKILHHPNWRTGIFPSTLLSSAPPNVLKDLVMKIRL